MREPFNVGAGNQRCLEESLPCNEPLKPGHFHQQCFNNRQKCLNCSRSVKTKSEWEQIQLQSKFVVSALFSKLFFDPELRVNIF